MERGTLVLDSLVDNLTAFAIDFETGQTSQVSLPPPTRFLRGRSFPISEAPLYRGLPVRKRHHRALGTGPLQDPRVVRFLVSEAT